MLCGKNIELSRIILFKIKPSSQNVNILIKKSKYLNEMLLSYLFHICTNIPKTISWKINIRGKHLRFGMENSQ